MAQVIYSHPAWARRFARPANGGAFIWPTVCKRTKSGEMGMADIKRESSQEYWRPAPSVGNPFPAPGPQMRGNEASCPLCATPYSVGARFCHACGLSREGIHEKQHPVKRWLDLDVLRTQFGFSTASLVLVLAALIFTLATLMIGMVYNTSTAADWQAVQTWRIEWLLATVAALLGAMLFKTKP